jgi:hypothetical protein
VRGTRNSTTAIHKLLTMELLFRRFFDAQPSDYDSEAAPSCIAARKLRDADSSHDGSDDRRGIRCVSEYPLATQRPPLDAANCPARHWTSGCSLGAKTGITPSGLGTALMEQNIRLEVIGSDDVDGPEFQDNPRARFHNLHGSLQSASLARRISRILLFYLRLFRFTVTARPKIFHILWNNKLQAFDRTLLMMMYKLMGKKVVLTAHNVNAGRRDKKDSWSNRMTLKCQYRLADHIFVHTGKMKDELVGEFDVKAEKVTVIPYGINNAVPYTRLTSEEARRTLGLAKDEKVILYFGAIKEYKGLEYLVAAFQRIAASGNYRLIIAGERKKGHEEYWRSIQKSIEADACREKNLAEDRVHSRCRDGNLLQGSRCRRRCPTPRSFRAEFSFWRLLTASRSSRPMWGLSRKM